MALDECQFLAHVIVRSRGSLYIKVDLPWFDDRRGGKLIVSKRQ